MANEYIISAGVLSPGAAANSLKLSAGLQYVSAGVTVDATLGTIAIAGYDPTVLTATEFSATLEQITATAYNPTVLTATEFTATLGSITATGYNPDLAADVTFTVAAAGSITATKYDPTIVAAISVSATLGTITVTPYNPTIAASSPIDDPNDPNRFISTSTRNLLDMVIAADPEHYNKDIAYEFSNNRKFESTD